MTRKLVRGVGINDADYFTQGKNPDGSKWMCPFYQRWGGMLERCYSKKYLEKRPTYLGCSVCEEWKLFSNFKSWMEQQDWKGKQLDRDILYRGNKEYSPSTCVFVNSEVNNVLTDSGAIRGEYPLGVSCDKRHMNYMSYVQVSGKKKHLGCFLTPLEAHKAWQKAKAINIKDIALHQQNERVKLALLQRAEQLEDDVLNNKETIKL